MTYFINVTDHDGKIHQLEATVGFSLMEIIRDAGLDIEAICGGCCACATCHCYILSENQNVPHKNDEEDGMLDQLFSLQENSRLACQIPLIKELDNITIKIASAD